MNRIAAVQSGYVRACALMLVFALAGCEITEGSASEADGGSADVETVDAADSGVDGDVSASDVTVDVPQDVPGPDVPQPPTDAADVSGEVSSDVSSDAPSSDGTSVEDVEETINPADMVNLDCESDETCVVNCGAGGVCGEDKRCTFAVIDGCLIEDKNGDGAICRAAGQLEPGTTCMFCNPSWDAHQWTGNIASESFEEGTGSFGQVVQLSSGSDATWAVSEARAATGESSLYFGDPEHVTYDVGVQAHAQIFAPIVVVPQGVNLTVNFSLWLDTEELPGYDTFKVLVKQDGESASAVWTSDELDGSTHGVFVPVALVLENLGGSSVQIGFSFDSLDDLDNDYEGVYVDDVQITTDCCATGGDCDDANPCTVDACPGYASSCTHKVLETCCSSDSDCDDGDACTIDVCLGSESGCEHQATEGCCLGDGDCDDGDPCTTNSCTEVGGECVAEPSCCESNSDCDDADSCTTDSCFAGACLYDYTCCTSDAACNDGEYCTIDSCVGGACVQQPAVLPGCCSPEIESQNFDGASVPFGWTGAVDSGVGWTVADVGKSQSGSQVLYYGNPDTLNYDNGGSNSGTITSGSIFLPAGLEASLSFKAYLDVESASWSDLLTVKLIAESNTITVATKSNLTIKGWKTFTTDISYLAGQSVKLAFTFETTSASSNSTLGVLIDDLIVGTTCEAKACTSNGSCTSQDSCLQGVCAASACTYVNSCCYENDECNDAQVCTIDSCQNGNCNFAPIPDCCEDLDDCDDGNPCTTDLCSDFGGSCSWEDVDGCCLTHGDCEDNDGCTQDKCTDDVCQNIWICCGDDAECDDGDDVCTSDSCVNQFCAFNPTGEPGCCESNPVQLDFESLVALEITNSSNPCTWQVATTDQNQTLGGTKVLYYGDVGSNNYDCGLNSGTVITETFSLLDGVAYNLSFKLMMDTETSTSYDKLFIYAMAAGQEIELWNKSKLTASKGVWKTYEANFNGFAGQDVQLKFFFNTGDSVLNATKGVFVDDISITSTCLPHPCSSNVECNDELGGTSESCAGISCSYSIP
jgi:hypothetical protein